MLFTFCEYERQKPKESELYLTYGKFKKQGYDHYSSEVYPSVSQLLVQSYVLMFICLTACGLMSVLQLTRPQHVPLPHSPLTEGTDEPLLLGQGYYRTRSKNNTEY